MRYSRIAVAGIVAASAYPGLLHQIGEVGPHEQDGRRVYMSSIGRP